LLKLGIDLHRETIRRILKDFRKRGMIKKSLTWRYHRNNNPLSSLKLDLPQATGSRLTAMLTLSPISKIAISIREVNRLC